MRLIQPLPPNRDFEQIKNHYIVEKSIADKLKKSTREERKSIYAHMYEELFKKVPDHPRLTRRNSSELTSSANKSKFSIIRNFLKETEVFLEFAPGDSRFSAMVADHVKFVYGVDISDQRSLEDIFPENFKLIVYDGYNLEKIEDNSVDIAFSDQLIEHFHPDDTRNHFGLIHRKLKNRGKYIFRTPHFLTGPHDISYYFSNKPECFHLKEWTYREIKKLIEDAGFSTFVTYRLIKRRMIKTPYNYYAICERLLNQFPKKYVRGAAKLLISSLCGVAIK